MAYKTIIAEKPSVAKAIAKIVGASTSKQTGPCGYLEGNGYRVTWAFGHLVGLKTPREMGMDSTALPLLPEIWETKIIESSTKEDFNTKQMKVLESLFRGASEIIVATDAGREGELIFRYIYEYLDCRTPFKRLWISSLTDEAIRKGMKELKDGHEYDALSDAAHCRSEADWLVGMNASTALKLATHYPKPVSLGRVQTPTLGMICERYLQYKNFKPEPYWVIQVDTEKSGTAFSVLSENKYTDKTIADNDLRRTQEAGMLVVESVEKKRTATKPPLLYDLTSLQRAANTKYGLTADETLKTAQKLYEGKLLSYPRTGSRYIPEDVFKTIPELIDSFSDHNRFGTYAKSLKNTKLCKKSVNNSKVTDHHALLPTGNNADSLKGNEKIIFDMVLARMLEAFGPDYIADVTNAVLKAGPVKYKAHGSIPVTPGWKAVLGFKENDNENEKDEDNQSLPELEEQERLPIKKASQLAKETKPQPIFTDSSLLGEMETCGKKIDDEEMREAMKDVGLGTPATRAEIIEKLLLRGYVFRESKKLIPTELGLQIWDMVKGRKISDVKTTGEWERDLALIEQKKNSASVFNRGIQEFVRDIVSDLQQNCKPLDGVSSEKERKCPCCGKTLLSQKYTLTCPPEKGGCGLKIYREAAGKKLSESMLDALCQGKTTPLIKGFKKKDGTTFSARLCIDKENKKMTFAFDTPNNTLSEEFECPKCHSKLTETPYALKCECGLSISKSICGKNFTSSQIRYLLSGKSVHLDGMTSKSGKKFSANLNFNKDENKIEFKFDNTNSR